MFPVLAGCEVLLSLAAFTGEGTRQNPQSPAWSLARLRGLVIVVMGSFGRWHSSDLVPDPLTHLLLCLVGT